MAAGTSNGMAARLRRPAAVAEAAPGDAAAAESGGLPPPPYPPLVGSEAGSFANATITSRLPAILESMIQDVEAATAEGLPGASSEQVSACVSELRGLREAMLRNAPLEPLVVAGAPEQTQALLDTANAAVELASARQQRPGEDTAADEAEAWAGAGAGGEAEGSAGPPLRTWLGLPWLTVECFMYAAIHAALQRQPALAALDPFSRQKAAAWAKSAGAAADMAAEVEMLLNTLYRPSQLPRELQQQKPHQPAAHQQQSNAAGNDGGSGSRTNSVAPDVESSSSAAAAVAAAEAAARLAALAGVRIALWGNKADLSLLAGAAGLEEHHLAAPPAADAAAATAPPAAAGPDGGGGGSGESAASAAAVPATRIIVDEGEALWGAMAKLRARRAAAATAAAAASGSGGGGGGGGYVRVDIVLDNSGLELFADLCLADLLLEAGVADRVVLHGKTIPWFVSDTLAADLEGLLASCEAERPPGGGQLTAAAWEGVRRLAARWRRHLAPREAGGDGAWRWAAHPFWTTPAPFAWMADLAPDLYGDLQRSDLLVFKGDLNYRKLTHDCRWPHTTPFEVALQGFRPAPLVALRTLKADVAVGLAPGLDEVLSAADPDWLVNGKWGMVQVAL